MLQFINIEKLIVLAQSHPEIKRLCSKNMPIYLLQMELERYNYKLPTSYFKELKRLKLK